MPLSRPVAAASQGLFPRLLWMKLRSKDREALASTPVESMASRSSVKHFLVTRGGGGGLARTRAAGTMTRVGGVTVRTELRPGDIGEVVRLHGALYAREHGFDVRFEAYVAEPLARFAIAGSPRERMWIAERDGTIVGCVAIVAASATTAQLRWFLVDPSARGKGLGGALLDDALAFSRAQGYRSILLWTVDALVAAARLYVSRGFALAERKPARQWGADVVEERYERDLG